MIKITTRMKGSVRALYRILVCTALIVVGTRASDDFQIIAIDSDSETKTSMSPLIQNEDINLLPELSDNPLYNFACFVLTQTEKIKTAHSSCSPSNNTILHKHDMGHPKENAEQIGSYSGYSHSTVCEPDTEYSLSYCNPNKLVQKNTESESLGNYAQSSKAKRHKKAIEENMARRKQKKTEDSTASSIGTDSTDNDELDSSKINRIKRNISTWNNARLKNRHREGQHSGYKPAVAFNKFGENIYNEIGDEMHQSLIETHVNDCKAVYSEIPVQNEFWFAIASRTSRMHTKHADCRAMNETPSDYKFIEELSGYYPGMSGDIVRYMDKNGPIVSKQESIKTEWTETLGDIHIRKSIKSEYEIDKETITFEDSNVSNPIATAVRMILALFEVCKDLSNITAEFIEKTLEAKPDLNHLKVVKELHIIVSKHKSSNKSNIDEQYAVLCNVFRDIHQKTCVSYESIVVRLYAEMYKSITYFYEKAEVCEEIPENKRKNKCGEKEYYLLAGKCIIKSQRYLKCTTAVDLSKPASEYKHWVDDKETNKWSISLDIKKHYHIHYVNNTKQQYTRVCLPMCLGPMHTIGQTIEYIKKIYSIKKKEYICPYRRDQFGYWKYIGEKERDKTVQEFTDYDIVFYYIEEGLRKNYFTFAEFELYIQPKDKTVRIPLFLSPLIRSAVSMGPFEEKDKIKHKLVDSMQSMCLQPSVYIYEEEYKAIKYSHVHHYYSNLCIRRDNADVPTIDCYIMDSKTIIRNNTVTVEWYAKIPNSADEYTHCILSNELANDPDKYNTFSKAVKSQEYAPDSKLYGFGLQSSTEKTSGLDGVGCSTDHPINTNSITDCTLSIVPIHKTPTNPMIDDLQSAIDELDKKHININMMLKEPGITEEQKNELKKKRQNINSRLYRNRQKLKNIQPENQSFVEKELSVTPLPICSFLVFRRSNTQTKSGLGAHNEILDSMSHQYNNLSIRVIS